MIYYCCDFCVFVFKQKTAYDMRISDWSSDVCSSDLHVQIDEHHSAKDFAFYRNEATLAFVQAGEIARFGHREQRAVPAISPAVIGAHEPLGCAGRFQHDAGTAMPADIVKDRKSTRLNSSH